MAEMLPKKYGFLLDEPGPRMLVEALKLYGITEKEGAANNTIILSWADEVGLLATYTADSIPWCGLFIGVVAKRSGKALPVNPLWARNWARWGEMCAPELGAVLVFVRDGGGHVGLYVGEDRTHFHVLGGNQSDQVCIRRIEKDRLLASRCLYRNKPANIRRIKLGGGGESSSNER
jgi:uncharacterized protein (TIGR02594 family)